MTNSELEAITGLDSKTVYAKNVLYQVLEQMVARYGETVTDTAFASVFAEVFDLEIGGDE